MILLKHALEQTGPYQGQDIPLEISWFKKELEKKIASIDWKSALQDVENFLPLEDKRFVENWSESLFHSQTEKLQGNS